jgi:hypothetical protein
MIKVPISLKWEVFYWQFCLIPVALPLFSKNNIVYRMLLIFGVRVAYWTVSSA